MIKPTPGPFQPTTFLPFLIRLPHLDVFQLDAVTRLSPDGVYLRYPKAEHQTPDTIHSVTLTIKLRSAVCNRS